MSVLIVFVTTRNSEEARKIATALVEEKLAACINMVPLVRSTYWWKGKIENDEETLLIIKTLKEKFQKLSQRVHALHSYTVPEVLGVSIARGSPKYVKWLKESLRR